MLGVVGKNEPVVWLPLVEDEGEGRYLGEDHDRELPDAISNLDKIGAEVRLRLFFSRSGQSLKMKLRKTRVP
jgi:hypothetical protein